MQCRRLPCFDRAVCGRLRGGTTKSMGTIPNDWFGSKSEELNVSKSSPLHLTKQSSTRRATTSLMGHLRPFKRGMSALAPVAIELLHYSTRRSEHTRTVSFDVHDRRQKQPCLPDREWPH